MIKYIEKIVPYAVMIGLLLGGMQWEASIGNVRMGLLESELAEKKDKSPSLD